MNFKIFHKDFCLDFERSDPKKMTHRSEELERILVGIIIEDFEYY